MQERKKRLYIKKLKIESIDTQNYSGTSSNKYDDSYFEKAFII